MSKYTNIAKGWVREMCVSPTAGLMTFNWQPVLQWYNVYMENSPRAVPVWSKGCVFWVRFLCLTGGCAMILQLTHFS